ncbi:PucR family transcriptional regulator [Nonomuraea sp. CA-218870]|uniref:PucR family transcriptional regulator n=1 Tax=Nonomuraea sp. CA-218870 TaxID=3239998 RepID=UPI003D8DA870
MIAALQRIADRLGAALDRPVAIDDTQLRQYVYTYHPSGNDPAREQSILRRHASPDILRWVAAHRAPERRSAFLLPANPSIGMTCPRWGGVVRVGGKAVAYIWVQVDDPELGEPQRRQIEAAAESVAEVFQRQRHIDELRSLSERESLIQLLSGSARARFRAVERIVDADIFRHEWPAAVAVFLPFSEAGAVLGEAERTKLSAALESVRMTLPLRQSLSLVRQNHGLLVVARPDDRATPRHTLDRKLAETAREKVQLALSATGPFTVWAGIGNAYQLSDLVTSYREALRAAQVAASLGTIGQTVHHTGLGVYARIARLVDDEPKEIGLHPGIRLLIEREHEGAPLAETLEVFLDNAGDVARSAQQLHLHRASLYGRLRRIEELTGLDLGNGHDRLVAHLELKLARLLRFRRPGGVDQAGATTALDDEA